VAALQFGIPIISVTIENDAGELLRGHYRERADLALECIVTFCLAGPAEEELFCGLVADGSDRADYEMARHYLARQFDLFINEVRSNVDTWRLLSPQSVL
jgi:hypothetical protein